MFTTVNVNDAPLLDIDILENQQRNFGFSVRGGMAGDVELKAFIDGIEVLAAIDSSFSTITEGYAGVGAENGTRAASS